MLVGRYRFIERGRSYQLIRRVCYVNGVVIRFLALMIGWP